MTKGRAVRRPLRVGLTGSIGSGKSTVARLLRERGAAVVDADVLAREATDDPAVLDRISSELGEGLVVRGPEGPRLDRAATAARVFGDDAALAKLNAVIHPWVRRRSAEITSELQASAAPPPVIVYDVPLLYESGLERAYDVVVVVDAPFEARRERLAARSGMSPEEVARREAAQLSSAEKAARADHVLVNAGGEQELAAQVDRLWSTLTG
ncbi:MAG TPA: dephospho-CoA kinase [Trueperaceae bacterium]